MGELLRASAVFALLGGTAAFQIAPVSALHTPHFSSIGLVAEGPQPGPTTEAMLSAVRSEPATHMFQATMDAVEEDFEVLEVPFSVGPVESAAGTNMGSAKCFSMGKLFNLSEAETLVLFGEHYRGVIDDPDGDAHPNIRAFMAGGWDCISFPDGLALTSLECDVMNPETCF